MRLSLVALAVSACGGAETPASPSNKGTSDFADVERCLYSITSTFRDLDRFVSTCGGRLGATPWAKLEAAANWLATRREDAVRAGNTALVAWIDFVTRGATFRLPENLPGVELPTSAVTRPRLEAYLTLVTIDKVQHQPATYASLNVASSPLIERETFAGHPGLLAADRSLPAARLLEVALDPKDDHAFVAVRTPAGRVAAHRVWFDPLGHGNAYRLDLGADATVAELVAALDDAAAKGFSTASGLDPLPWTVSLRGQCRLSLG